MTDDHHPVVIPIESVSDNDVKEWAMIEVNGELLSPRDNDAIATQELVELGSLTYGKDKKVRNKSLCGVSGALFMFVILYLTRTMHCSLLSYHTDPCDDHWISRTPGQDNRFEATILYHAERRRRV